MDTYRRWAQPVVSLEAIVLALMCTLDMLSSAVLFHAGMAVEANPLLRPFAEAGPVPFMLAKSVSFVPALWVMESYRRHRPENVIPLMRWGAAAYAVIYLGCVGPQLFR
jgi:hypothetical protein